MYFFLVIRNVCVHLQTWKPVEHLVYEQMYFYVYLYLCYWARISFRLPAKERPIFETNWFFCLSIYFGQIICFSFETDGTIEFEKMYFYVHLEFLIGHIIIFRFEAKETTVFKTNRYLFVIPNFVVA